MRIAHLEEQLSVIQGPRSVCVPLKRRPTSDREESVGVCCRAGGCAVTRLGIGAPAASLGPPNLEGPRRPN